MERLCANNGVEPKVEYTPANDYPYRMNFEREKQAEVIAKECVEIDYPKFKPAVHDGTVRDNAYLDCFYVLWRASDSEIRKKERRENERG